MRCNPFRPGDTRWPISRRDIISDEFWFSVPAFDVEIEDKRGCPRAAVVHEVD